MAATASCNAQKPDILVQYHNPARSNSSDPAEIRLASAEALFYFLRNVPGLTKAHGTSITVYGLKQVDLQALFSAVSSHQKLEMITLAQATDISLPSVLMVPSTLKSLELMYSTEKVFKDTMSLVQKHWWRKELNIYKIDLHGGHRFVFNSKYQNRFPSAAPNQPNAADVPFPAAWFD